MRETLELIEKSVKKAYNQVQAFNYGKVAEELYALETFIRDKIMDIQQQEIEYGQTEETQPEGG